ncbi:MAG: hypothetical protein ACR652_13655 [Methylocystis sp.]|uniref:hypothetical protein n=1 Tax=Methylocystis sp. TaxID=1911079 RepID=UPI003DA2A3CF
MGSSGEESGIRGSAGKSGADGLERIFGLDASGVAALGEMFARISGEVGLNGSRILERLKEGQPLGDAFALPRPITEEVYARARQWLQLGHIEKAAPLFRALVAIDPKDADFWIGNGVCLRDGGRLMEARLAFKTAAMLRPNWGLPHFHLSSLALCVGDRESARRALAAFRASVDPNLPREICREAERLAGALSPTKP